jgi:hypothetical protein
MRAKTVSGIPCLFALSTMISLLFSEPLRSAQPKDSPGPPIAITARVDQTPEPSTRDDLKSRLEAVFKIQLEALEAQKRQLAADEEEQARQIKERETQAVVQLKAEFEHHMRQLNRETSSQIEQLKKAGKRQAAQLDQQAETLKAELSLRIAVLSFQVSVGEAQLKAGTGPAK